MGIYPTYFYSIAGLAGALSIPIANAMMLTCALRTERDGDMMKLGIFHDAVAERPLTGKLGPRADW